MQCFGNIGWGFRQFIRVKYITTDNIYAEFYQSSIIREKLLAEMATRMHLFRTLCTLFVVQIVAILNCVCLQKLSQFQTLEFVWDID